MSDTNIRKSVFVLILALFVFILLKNAWVAEDAYITFRSVEQFFAGHGIRWNPQERVQVFTSPLWFFVLSLIRAVSTKIFLNAVIAGAMFSIAAVLLTRKMIHGIWTWTFLIVLLLCSNAFFDYTTSGLENALGYFLIVLFVYYYLQIFPADDSSHIKPRTLIRFSLVFGLISVCRHDLVTLVFLPTVYVFWAHRKDLSARWRLCALAAALSPLFIWSIFSLIYYGFPFPNTAYAKLNTGLSRAALVEQGFNYLYVSLRADTITLSVIFIAIVSVLSSGKRHFEFIGYGILTNLLYIVLIGGDFMQGRFLSYAYLLSAVAIFTCDTNKGVVGFFKIKLKRDSRRMAAAFVTIVCVLYAVLYAHTPVNSSLDYEYCDFMLGVADERGFYFKTSSLWKYVTDNDAEYFPKHEFSRTGYQFSRSQVNYAVATNIGYLGYWAGLDKIIVDTLALTDPLLARLPIPDGSRWRVGHYHRNVPDGYRESIANNTCEIVDPDLNEYYKKLVVITQSDRLLSRERIKTILAMNLGLYDNYLESWKNSSR